VFVDLEKLTHYEMGVRRVKSRATQELPREVAWEAIVNEGWVLCPLDSFYS
jgi:hypothetical protein